LILAGKSCEYFDSTDFNLSCEWCPHRAQVSSFKQGG
jgi:hypothetical protein